MSKLVVPSVLTSGKLPDNAVYELETHMAYIISKYGLDKRRIEMSLSMRPHNLHSSVKYGCKV